jgi:ribosomal protein S17
MAKKTVEKKVKLRKTLDAIVTNVIDTKTAKVKVETKFAHPKYGRIVKTHKSYLVDITKIKEVAKDQKVLIGEVKPISRRKTWEIIEIIK